MSRPTREALRSRYERLLVQGGTELYLALETLHVHPSELAIPAPARPYGTHSPSVEHLFSPFGVPKLAELGNEKRRDVPVQVDAPLGTDVLRSILAVAGQGQGPFVRESKPPPEVTKQPTFHNSGNHIERNETPSSQLMQHFTPAQPAQIANNASLPSDDTMADPPPAPVFDLRRSTNTFPSNRHNRQKQQVAPTPDSPEEPANAFRTARSRLPAKRLLRGNNRTSGANRGSALPGRSDTATDMGTSTAMAATRAVLGAKRARFSTPRVNGAAEAAALSQPAEGADIPEVPNVDPKLVEMIMNEMLDRSPEVDWDDIAGLQFAKRCVMEAVVWPMKRPDIFTGLRGPPKGLLLFGPPGTGKTLIGRAIASKSGARFFNISASSLMSKWVGEGEKMVRALFGVARELQPSVVFIDEIDSLLTQRTDGEQESTRRVKTEFLVQMDGAATSRDDRVLVVGATNRPQELDEAARRRLVKRLYIPLPDPEARSSLIARLLQRQTNSLQQAEVAEVARLTEGYSGSDLYAVCAEAALGPVRELGEAIGSVDVDRVRPVGKADFEMAIRMVRASVSKRDLEGYVEWNKTFGSFPTKD